MLVALLRGAWSAAAAQNGFTGAQRVLGSGFSNAYGIKGVAVDVGGNIYVADGSGSAVKEILTVNGSIPATPTVCRTLLSIRDKYA